MAHRDLTLIVAATNKMGIGLGGKLPWKGLKKEIQYFARVTKRADPESPNVVIMGRKTWDSIPKKFRPLEGRVNITCSRSNITEDKVAEDGSIPRTFDGALKYLDSTSSKSRAFVIGGAEIYKSALEHNAKRILLTRILTDFECDTIFPLTPEELTAQYEKKSHEELCKWTGEEGLEEVQEENGVEYRFEMWERR